MSRFWRCQDPDLPDEVIYFDPNEIIQLERITNEEGDYYYVMLRCGESLKLDLKDGKRLMNWAESEAETIPEVAQVEKWLHR